MQSFLWFKRTAATLSFFLLFSCTHTEVVKPLTTQETARLNKTLGLKLAKKFESQLRFNKDKEVSRYVQQITHRLGEAMPDLKAAGESKVDIWLIRSNTPKWKSYSLPGGRLYLSSEVIRMVEFENELAAEIAIQLSTLRNKNILNHLSQDLYFSKGKRSDLKGLSSEETEKWIDQVEFMGENGLFSFSEDEEGAALEGAVDILYRTGYDSRGILTLLDRFKKNPAHSPYLQDKIDRFKEGVRRKIALYTPLLNPIIKTQEFRLMRNRMGKL